ncbi:DUF554 family protein [Janibacter cremeus]|uniref:DUF554 domain-containing protein n=1 Tax=Janibacter cremeus TaxID=1285192 RepID=A0A852W1U3_9MICO|nr:hypothetical protein [Janibacter cremeus]
MSFIGAGTALNVLTVIVGALAGMAIGGRLPQATRDVVTDCLGLVTLLMAALSVMEVLSPALTAAVGSSAPVLIVLGSLLIGSILGSLVGIERRLESLAGRVQGYLGRGRSDHDARERFIEGWLTASLLFCVGPLTILGSLDDGLGRGIDKLALKSALDGFAALAFASTFGIGVLMSAVSVAVVQGSLTIAGVALGAVLPEAYIAALTATGGLILVGIALRLLRIRQIPVGDMLPALVIAPVLTHLVVVLG